MKKWEWKQTKEFTDKLDSIVVTFVNSLTDAVKKELELFIIDLNKDSGNVPAGKSKITVNTLDELKNKFSQEMRREVLTVLNRGIGKSGVFRYKQSKLKKVGK